MFTTTTITEAQPEMPEQESNSWWKKAVQKKRQERLDKTPKKWLLSEDFIASLKAGPDDGANLMELDVPRKSGIMSGKEIEITENYAAGQLLDLLAKGQMSSLEITTAFCKRAAIAQQLLSCVTEVCYAEALERARYLDGYLQKEGKVMGPFHGLPISIKDTFKLKGLQTTIGYSSFLSEPPADSNSAVVDMLLDMGAVLYVKTNVPQTLMTADSDNNIFGRTLNPLNTSLNAGGSSGGEGSLVAFRGSILGVGTDIAGSIRIPSLCCGLYGFKPSTGRVPFAGQVSGVMEGLPGPVPSAGPLAHNMDDLQLFVKAVLNANPADYDSTAYAVPWQNIDLAKSERPLTIGVLPEEKIIPLQPPIRRTIKNAVEALKRAGHNIIMLPENPDCSVAYSNLLAFEHYILGPDQSGEHFGPEGEPSVDSVNKKYNPMFAGPLPVPMDLEPLYKIDALHVATHKFREAWRKWWVSHKLDVLLCPAAQNTAVPHDTYGWPPYTQIWNVVDYPACIIPYGKVSKYDDPEPNPEDDFGPQPNYNPEATHEAPCALQIVTRNFQDEKCLAAAKIIDEVLRNDKR